MDDQSLRLKKEDLKRRAEIENKAANNQFKPGSVQWGRYIDPNDYDRWERQRMERKAKNQTLDPYR